MLCINKEEDLEGLNDNVKDLFLNIDIEIVLPPRLKSLTVRDLKNCFCINYSTRTFAAVKGLLLTKQAYFRAKYGLRLKRAFISAYKRRKLAPVMIELTHSPYIALTCPWTGKKSPRKFFMMYWRYIGK